MSASPEFVDYILDMLEPLGNITKQRMFGGAVIKSSGKQIGVIFGDEFYFKIDASLQKKYREHGSRPFEYQKKDKVVQIKSWYLAPEEIMENPEEFLEWAFEAVDSRDT